MPDDVAHGLQCAFVDWATIEVAVGERVREGVGLELEADLDDVERGGDKAG